MEHIALYRQFRPSTFDEIVEQEATVSTLRRAVTDGKIGHAYLFCGQRGTGKTSIARVFSRAINCESPVNGNPCNKCSICKSILDGTSMDVIEIDAASNTSVENIKRICDEVVYAPTVARYKVYIIDEVHMLSKGASNALLKTLEEPPVHAVFLFATTEINKILPTIISRCQRYDFRRISSEAIVTRLKYICMKEDIHAADDALALISMLSDGAMRDAVSLLDQAASFASGKTITTEMIEGMTGTVNTAFLADMTEALIKSEYDKVLERCNELAVGGKDTIQFSLDLTKYFRDLLVIRVIRDPAKLITGSGSTMRRMYELASLTSADTLVAFITYMSKTISDLRWSPSPKTSFELSMLRLAGRKVKADVPPLKMPDSIASAPAEKKTEAEPAAKEVKEEPGKKDLPPVASSLRERLDILKAKTEEPKKAELPPIARTPVPREEPVPAPVPEPEPAPSPEIPPAAPEKKDPEDEPMENQIDIFSIGKKEEAPVHEKPSEEKTEDNVFASLSDSLFDDEPADKEEEDEDGQHRPTGRIGETARTSLSVAVGETPIATRKKPYTPYELWDEILGEVRMGSPELYGSMSQLEFRVEGDSVFMLLPDESMDIVVALRDDPVYKRQSGRLKTELPEIAHVYLCTDTQYRNAMKVSKKNSSDGSDDAQAPAESKAEQFMRKSREMGIDTQIHFGDE